MGRKGDENCGKTEVDMVASRLAQLGKEVSAVRADGGEKAGRGAGRLGEAVGEPQVPGVVHLDENP